ncbi:MAG: hypothetical protein MZV70_16930 [Desulfobacterales bacterium]|nr:hypothetical protein [Desulfobacterales bacterium]
MLPAENPFCVWNNTELGEPNWVVPVTPLPPSAVLCRNRRRSAGPG